MTLYKIIYKTAEGTYDAHITERNEAAARKTFKKQCDGEIVAVEFVRSNVSATKQQERDALAKIREMVEELGPDSYLRTAFAGCFEIAEQNIEFDFADSMKGRVEAAEKTIAELKDKLESSEKDWEAAHEAAHQIAEQKDAEIAELREQVEALRQQVLSEDDMEAIAKVLEDRECNDEEGAAKAAEEIVRLAEDPSSAEFQEAVRLHRQLTGWAEKTRQLRWRVTEAQNAQHNGARRWPHT